MAWNVLDQLNKNAVAAVIDDSPRARFRTKDISIRKMYSNDANFYSMPDIESLAQDIYVFGLIENLTVVYAPCERGDYRITAGERRWRALNLLVEQGHTEFEVATCQILTPQSDNEERLLLIAANAYRDKTISDLLEEERQTKEALQEMKDKGQTLKGYDLNSGRLRDVIADILRISAGKVGQIESINRHLIPEFVAELKEGRLTFSAAYEISGMFQEAQKELFETYTGRGLTFKEVRDIKKHQEEQIEGQSEIAPDGSLPGMGGEVTDSDDEQDGELSEIPQEAEVSQTTVNDVCETDGEYQDAHPESATSLCWGCKRYAECDAKTSTCVRCDMYIDKAEAEKTPEQRYDEEQAAIDRETRKTLRQQEDDRRMEKLPSAAGEHQKVHEVRMGAASFADAASGVRSFELRKNDCGYAVGDILELQEYRDGTYTGRSCRKRVTYTLEEYTGLVDGYCILGCELIGTSDSKVVSESDTEEEMDMLENYDNMPDWLKKCLTCKHAYKTRDNDLEWKCRCRNSKCNYKEYKFKED